MENLFEKASRQRIRFNHKGVLNVEDLWTLSLGSLDSIYKSLKAQSKEKNEESLLNVKSKEDELIDLKIEIVKYVFETLSNERRARMEAADLKVKQQKILGIIADKEDEGLRNMSIEDLKKLV